MRRCEKCGTEIDYLCQACFMDRKPRRPQEKPIEETTVYKMCQKKMAYFDNWSAIKAARSSSERTHENIEPYKCPYGMHWHIGHSNPGNKRIQNEKQSFRK